MASWKFFAKRFGKNYSFIVAVVGNFLCIFSGISLAWSSPVLDKLKGSKDNPLGNPITDDQNDLIGSVFSIGGAVGPLAFMYFLEIFGRKYTITILAAIYPVFHFVLAFSKNINLYYISRIALGMAVGGSFCIVPVYISEISSMKMRGTHLTLASSFILTGCLISYSVAPFILLVNFYFIIAACSSLYVILFIISCPESLYFTMQKYGTEETLTILEKLRTEDNFNDELQGIRHSSKNKKGTFLDVFRSKSGRRAFFLTTSLLILQQFCGVNVITTFTQQIFEDAKVSIAPDICTIIVGAIQFATCMITPISTKYFNRKSLLTVSFAGVSASNALIGSYFHFDYLRNYQWIPILSLVCFVVFYNCGLASLPWANLAELYPLNTKSVGTAMSTTIYWIFQFMLTFFFNKIDHGTSFLAFSVICLLSIGFVKVFLIETRGKTLQEIQRILER